VHKPNPVDSSYRLESLEPRLLLSGNGLIDEAVALTASPSETATLLQENQADEEITLSDQKVSSYDPEAQLSDLFATDVSSQANSISAESEQDGLAETPDAAEQTGALATHGRADDAETSPSSPTPTHSEGSNITDELVETLNAAEPPPDGGGFGAPSYELTAVSAPWRGQQNTSVLSSAEQLQPIVEEARGRWAVSGLFECSALEVLDQVSVEIADLPGLTLGHTTGYVVSIDIDAAGYGWFVDPTPTDQVEFAAGLAEGEYWALSGVDAAGRMDLLTVVMHEMGHVLGVEHSEEAGLMAERLDVGQRYVPLPVSVSLETAAQPVEAQQEAEPPDGSAEGADLSLIKSGLQDFFHSLQTQLNDTVFDAVIPLVGDQLSTDPVGQFATVVEFRLDAMLPGPTPVSVTRIEGELDRTLGNLIDGQIDVSGSDGDPIIQFQLTLSGTTTGVVDVDLALGEGGVIEPLLDIEDMVDVTVSWELTLSFGVMESAGVSEFFVDTAASNELQVTVVAELREEFSGKGKAGVFGALIEADSVLPSSFSGTYSIDLVDPETQPGTNNRLMSVEIASLILEAELSGSGEVNLDIDASFVPDFVDAGSRASLFNLSVLSDARITYSYVGADPEVQPFGNPVEIEYEDVELDLGRFFSEFVDPTVEKIQEILDPIKPVVDFLTDPIPIISDLTEKLTGETVCALDLAVFASMGDSGIRSAVEKTRTIIQLIDRLLDLEVPVVQNLLGTTALGGFSAEVTVDLNDNDDDDAEDKNKAEMTSSEKSTDAEEETKNAGESSKEFFTRFGGILQFPFLQDPEVVFRMLLGDTTAELVTFGIDFSFGFLFSYTYPVFPGLLNAELGLELSATLDIDAGYDVFGVAALTGSLDFSSMDALQTSVNSNIHRLSDGFYFDDHLPEGVTDGDTPEDGAEFTLEAKLSAGASVGIDIYFLEAKAGVNAFFAADIYFDLNDLPEAQSDEQWDYVHDLLEGYTSPVPGDTVPAEPYTYDGRVRIGELELAFDADPTGVLNMSGALRAGMEAFVRVVLDFFFFSVTIVDESWVLFDVTIFDFNIHQLDDAEVLAGVKLNPPTLGDVGQSGLLTLYMGDPGLIGENGLSGTANLRQNTAPGRNGPDSETNEGFFITSQGPTVDEAGVPTGGETLHVTFLALEDGKWKARARQSFRGVTDIAAFGGNGKDQIVVDQSVAADVSFAGGSGDDVLSYLGTGEAVLWGGAGNDLLLGGNGADTLYGGGDNDNLLGGGGSDWLEGGSGRDRLNGEAGDDTLIGGPDGDTYVWNVGGGADVFQEDEGKPASPEERDHVSVRGSIDITGTSLQAGSPGVSQLDDQITITGKGGIVEILTNDGILLLDNIESVGVAAGGGADTIVLNDLTGTEVESLSFDLSSPQESARSDGDVVIYNAGETAGDTIVVEGIIRDISQTDLETGAQTQVPKPLVQIRDTTDGASSAREVLILNSDPDRDRLEIRSYGGDDTLEVAAGTADAHIRDLIDITLDSGAGDDTLSTVYADVEILAGPGSDSLRILDDGFGPRRAVTLSRTGPDAGHLLAEHGLTDHIRFQGVEESLLLALGDNESGSDLRVLSTIDAPLTINALGQHDTLQLQTLVAQSTTVNLFGVENEVTLGKNGTLEFIETPVTVHGGGGYDTLAYDNSSDAAGREIMVGLNNVAGLPIPESRVSFDGAVDEIALRLGHGTDATAVPELTRRVTIDGAEGTDSVEAVLFGPPATAAGAPGVHTVDVEHVHLANEDNDQETYWLVTDNQLLAVSQAIYDEGLPDIDDTYQQVLLTEGAWSVTLLLGDDPEGRDNLRVLDTENETNIDLREGDDNVLVGLLQEAGFGVRRNLDDIRAPLILTGGNGSDRLVLSDSESARERQFPWMDSHRIWGFVDPPTEAGIAHHGFEELEINLMDMDGYDLNVAGNSVPAKVAFGSGDDNVYVQGISSELTLDLGAGIDRVTLLSAQAAVNVDGGESDGDYLLFDGRDRTSPLIGTLTGGPASGLLTIADLVAGATFENVEQADLLLGSHNDLLTVNSSLWGTSVLVKGNGGDDRFIVERIGDTTGFAGDSGIDRLTLVIQGDPADPLHPGHTTHGDLLNDLSFSVETLIVDNSANSEPVRWRMAGGTLSVVPAGSDPIPIVMTDGADETLILAGSGEDTLTVEEVTGPVTATIDGDRVELLRGSVVLDPSGFLTDIQVEQATAAQVDVNLSELDGQNGFSLNGCQYAVGSAGDINGDGFYDVIIADGDAYVVFGQDGGFAAGLDLGTLNGSNGFRVQGYSAFESAALAGDVNGDGHVDLILGDISVRPGNEVNYYGGTGDCYVVFGGSENILALDAADGALDGLIKVSELDGTSGFRLEGIDPADLCGFSVASAGDVNDDGYGDVIIGAVWAYQAGQKGTGECYVVFGHAGGFPATLPLADLDGSNGFVLGGTGHSGRSVAGAGDMNGDGIDDLIIGGGGAYVVFGRTAGFPDFFDLGVLDGTNGFAIQGIDAYYSAVESVAAAGDVNGDGYDDVIVGAPGAGPAGEAYVVFGRAGGFPAVLSLNSLDGVNGFLMVGVGYSEDDETGYSVAGAGDFNGDGIDDVIIAAPVYCESTYPEGAVHVVFGRADGFPAVLQLGDLDGFDGFHLLGTTPHCRDRGRYVESVGDVNGDGIDDVIVGDPAAGKSYVVFGQVRPTSAQNILPGLQAMAVAPQGDRLVGVNPDRNALVIVDPDSLSVLQTFTEGFEGAAGLKGALAVAVSAARVYVASPGDPSTSQDDSIGIFGRDPAGVYRFMSSRDVSSYGTLRTLAVSPDGQSLYAGFDGGLVRFDSTSDTLDLLQSVLLPGVDVTSIAVSPDGQTLYAAGSDAAGSGELLRFAGGPGGTIQTIDTAGGISAIGLSPDGGYLYLASADDSTVLVYSENGDGLLEVPVQELREGFYGIRGIAGVSALAVSPDGEYLYVTGRESDSLAIFHRDPDSGELQFVQIYRNSGDLGLMSPNSVTVRSSDGKVFVGSSEGPGIHNGGVAAFARVSPVTPPSAYVVGFSDIEELEITTGAYEDLIAQIRPASTDVTIIRSGDGPDSVELLELGGETIVTTGAGEDSIEIRSAAAGTTLTVVAGGDDDRIYVRRTGAGGMTTIDAGSGDDLLQVAGDQLESGVTINGEDPTSAPGDFLLFDSAGKTVQESGSVPGDGTIGVAGRSAVAFTSIERREVFAPANPDAGGPYTTAEGSGVQLDASATNTFGRPASFAWDINGDGFFGDVTGEKPALTWSELAAFGLDDDGSYRVSVRVTNDLDQVAEALSTILIENTEPVVSLSGAASTVVGQEYSLAFTVLDNRGIPTDPGDDTVFQWEIDWGDGTVESYGSDAVSAAHVYLSTGEFPVVAAAVDEDGRYIENLDPALQVEAALPVLDEALTSEGQGVRLAAAAPGAPAFSWDLDGDGVFDDGTGSEVSLSWAALQDLGIEDDGVYPIRVRVAYTDYGSTAVRTAEGAGDLVVENAAPFAVFTNDGPVAEGQTVTISFSAQNDPSPVDAAGPFTYSYDFDNDGLFEVEGSASASVSLPARDSGSQVVRGRIFDKDGGYADYLSGITVREVAPVLTLDGDDVTEEGSAYTLELSAADPGEDAVELWIVDWGDGSPHETFPGATVELTHLFIDDGPMLIRVTALDEDGIYSASKSVSVANVAPALAVSGEASTEEGRPYTLALSSNDPGDDTLRSWQIDWGDGTSDEMPGGAGEARHMYADDGVYAIAVTATDEDGSYAVDPLLVSVANVAPVCALSGTAHSDEGSNFALAIGSPYDPGEDTVTHYLIDWGDGSAVQTVQAPEPEADGFVPALSVLHVYGDGEQQVAISLTLIDEDGEHQDVAALLLEVRNVAPTIRLSGPVSVDEGSVYTLTLSEVFDPGADTVLEYVVHWGDGEIASYQTSGKVTHVFYGAAERTITVDVIDEDGTYPETARHTVSVKDVAPVIELSGATEVEEGSEYVLTLGDVLDPGEPSGVVAVEKYLVRWGDGDTNEYAQGGDVTHSYDDGDFVYTVTVDVQVSGATYSNAGRQPVKVKNEVPVIEELRLEPAEVWAGVEASVVGSFADAGVLDTHTVVIDWGDGIAGEAAVDETDGSGSFSGAHTYEYAGTHVITVRVTDSDGAETEGVVPVTVMGFGLHDGVLYVLGTPGDDVVEVSRVSEMLLPVAYWSLNETYGWVVSDSAGTEQNGLFASCRPDLDDPGPPLWRAPYGAETGADFHGTKSEYIVVEHDAVFELEQGTVALWFRADSNCRNQTLLSKDSTCCGAGLSLSLQSSRLEVDLEGEGGVHLIRTDKIIEKDTWYHVALTFSDNGMRLYVDGQLVGENCYSGGLEENDGPLTMGAAVSRCGGKWKVKEPFDGHIDEVVIFADVLDPEQIGQLMMAGPEGCGDGGGEFIEVRASFLTEPVRFASEEVQRIELRLQAGNDQARIGEDIGVPVSIEGGEGNDTLCGPDVDTVWEIEGNGEGRYGEVQFAGIENLRGGGGRDWYVFADGGSVAGVVDGGAGTDVVDWSAWSAAVEVDLEAGEASGTGGLVDVERLVGGQAYDRLMGRDLSSVWYISGIDEGTMYSCGEAPVEFVGFEELVGGAGCDRFVFASEVAEVRGMIDGRAGEDTLDYSAWTEGVAVDLGVGAASAVKAGQDGGVQAVENVIGGWGDDQLTGDDADNRLEGNAGDDILAGGAGNDVLIGGSGDDTIAGGAGDDLILGDDVFGSLFPCGWKHCGCNRRGGDDLLFGDEGDDVVLGQGGRDVLYGGEGDDILLGGSGRDLLCGGPGDDSIHPGGPDVRSCCRIFKCGNSRCGRSRRSPLHSNFPRLLHKLPSKNQALLIHVRA
jgi:Ca2+-binding RTX toxin-like protein/WD40 repeat protein